MAARKKAKPRKKAARKAPRRKSISTRSSSSVEADARKYGFKRKKPKKPKSKTIASLEGYIRKMDQWKRDQSAAAAAYRKLKALKERVAKM